MKCPVCDVDMAPAVEGKYDIILFLCSCGQNEQIVTWEQVHDWIQQSMALQFVGKRPIDYSYADAEKQVEDTLAAVAAGLKILFRSTP
jgi:hypothetical protein